MYVVLMFRNLKELITHPLHESPLEKLQWVTLLNNPLTANFHKSGGLEHAVLGSAWSFSLLFGQFFP